MKKRNKNEVKIRSNLESESTTLSFCPPLAKASLSLSVPLSTSCLRSSRKQTSCPGAKRKESRSASRSGSAHGSGKSARHTPARSRSKEDSRRSRSKSRSRSESRSRSRRSSRRHYTRSRSRSRSHRRSRSRSYSRDYRRRHSHSHSPMSTRRRHVGNRANPDPNCCLGVFGLSLYTTERDLREVFSKYGPIADVSIVYDQQSRRSRGFAFVYFENVDDAKEVSKSLVPLCKKKYMHTLSLLHTHIQSL
uniref:Transformer-2 protein homolog beta n=1 Tax=Capra hircus TaxID=9925 RepID=A0A452F5B8_CAPHI